MVNANKQSIFVYQNGNNKVNHLQDLDIGSINTDDICIYIYTQNEF